MKLHAGEIWISETHPHESFKIYGTVIDTCEMDYPYEREKFEDYPEKAKVFCWERIDLEAFNNFIEEKLGSEKTNTYPYAFCGECKKGSLVNKIKKFNMKLSQEKCEIKFISLG